MRLYYKVTEFQQRGRLKAILKIIIRVLSGKNNGSLKISHKLK